MLCFNCKQTKSLADSHILCFRCCGCSQSTCSRSAQWALEIWEEIIHFPSHISANLEQDQGSLSTKQQDNRIKFKQLNSEPAPGLNLRLRGPRVAVIVPSNECLTRGPRPAPNDASRRKARQGAQAIPCTVGISEPRCLTGTLIRWHTICWLDFLVMYMCLPFRLRGRMAQIRVLFISPIFILGMAIAGIDIIPTLTFQMLPVMKPFLACLGGCLAMQN